VGGLLVRTYEATTLPDMETSQEPEDEGG